MKQTIKPHMGIRVTLYTHPLCSSSWQMHQHWMDFYKAYGERASFKICMSTNLSGSEEQLRVYKKDQACFAIKAASLQSELAAHLYLHALRQANWTEGLDVSNIDMLITIARRVGQQNRSLFNFNRFTTDLTSKQACKALSDDIKKAHINRIHLLPTVTITCEGKGIKLEGKKSYAELIAAFDNLMQTRSAVLENLSGPGR